MYVKHFPETEREKGHWKCNSSVLEDDNYAEQMKMSLIDWLNQYDHMDDKRVVWELLKYHIKKFTLTFSSFKQLDRD